MIPDYDKEAVYVSDMKKVFGWYNFLLEKDILEFTEEEEAGETAKEDTKEKGEQDKTDDEEADKT